MHEAEIVLGVVLEARGDTAELLEPRVQALDLPAAAVAPPRPPVLRLRPRPVRPVRRGQLDALHWHHLRHTFGTWLGEAGYSEATIAELMGHSDPKTTRRYTHATDRAKRAAVEAARPRTAEQQAKVMQFQK